MDNLNVQFNSQPPNDSGYSNPAKKWFSGPKIIFLILGLIILAEVIYAVKVLSSPTPSVKVTRRAEAQVTPGKISLNAAKTSLSVGEVVPVAVTIDTGNHEVSGVDVIVRFDPKILEASPASLTKGNILNEYPALSVDGAKGLVSISGISSLKNGFTGKGQFATVNFKTKVPGKTYVTVDFAGKGLTKDSNLVETSTSKDILEQVSNLDLTVQ